MISRRNLLPLWFIAVALAGAFSVTLPIAEPASPASVDGVSLPVQTPPPDAACAASPAELRLDTPTSPDDWEHLLCVDTIECGSCCAPKGQLKRFWDCCKAGYGLECEAQCNVRKP